MGQTRKKQLDRIVKKYPNKTAGQIAKDHKIPYSTVWNYMKRKQIPKVEVDVPKPVVNHKPVTYTKGDMMMAVVAGTITGVILCFLLGAM